VAAVLITVRPLAEPDVDPLLRFAAEYYGADSHQARRTRFDWLYRENPLSLGPRKDVVVAATEEGRVVGCHWKTRLAWRFNGQRVVIPSCHDLAILPDYRQGQGLALVLAGLAGEERAALLGLSPQSEGIYARLRCPEVPMVRLQKVLSYGRTALGMMGLAGCRRKETLVWKKASVPVMATAMPDDELLGAALLVPPDGDVHLEWTMETFRWRFFHADGPAHVLVLVGEPGAPIGRAVFSYGQRRGAVMARLVDLATAETEVPRVLEATAQVMRRLGVAVATAATTSQPALAWMRGQGWKAQQGVSARFFLRRREPLAIAGIWGGSYDYGYDAN
jgi:hypothetical protein